MKKSFIFVASLFTVFTLNAAAEVSEDMALVGTVKSYDTKFVTLVSKESTFKIPRELILLSEIKSGQEIQVSVKSADLDKYEVDEVPPQKKAVRK